MELLPYPLRAEAVPRNISVDQQTPSSLVQSHFNYISQLSHLVIAEVWPLPGLNRFRSYLVIASGSGFLFREEDRRETITCEIENIMPATGDRTELVDRTPSPRPPLAG